MYFKPISFVSMAIKAVVAVHLSSQKALPTCVCCSVEMLLQDFASLQQAFGLWAIVLVHIYKRQQREEIRCSYFFLFSSTRAQNLYLSERVHCVGIDRQPHKPRRLQLPQIKMGFGSFKSLFTLKRAFQTRALLMKCLWVLSATSPLDVALLWRTELSTHPVVCLWAHICYLYMCLCASAGGDVGDPAPWPQSSPNASFTQWDLSAKMSRWADRKSVV